MKTQINEIKRMQLLAGVINESQLNEAEDAASIVKAIDSELKAKNLKGVLATNVNNPQDDIAKNKVDYVTAIVELEAGTFASVYLNNTPENQAIAKEIHSKHGGDYSQGYNQGRIIGVTRMGAAKPQAESFDQLDEEEIKSVDQVLDTPKTQEISKKLSQDPALLQKSIDQLSKLGIDKNTLMKAAQAHSSGKDVGNIIDDKVETAVEKVNEASGFTDGGKILTGLAAGLTGLSLVGGLPVLAAAVILALVGAGAAVVGSKIDYKQQQQAESFDQLDEIVDKVLAKLRNTK
jgi:predicted metalloprotease